MKRPFLIHALSAAALVACAPLPPAAQQAAQQSAPQPAQQQVQQPAVLHQPLPADAQTQAPSLLPIEHWRQASGAQVWLVHSPSLPMVDVQIDFDGGARRDPADQAGLATATASMLTKGVRAVAGQAALDEDQLGQAWADLGASFEASASRDRFTLHLRSLTDEQLLPKAVALAARQIGQSAWPEAVWQRERQRWSTALREAQTRPGVIAGQAFDQAVYGAHPYGYQVQPQTLAQIGVRDMQAFYARHVQPCQAKVSVVGRIGREQADRLVHELLAQLPQATVCKALPAVSEVQPLSQASSQRIPFAAEQAQVLIGQPGIRRDDPDFLALLVANHILGGSGFGSRLMEQVREQRGLVYGVSSSFSPGNHAGAFTIGLQTRADQAEAAVQLVHELVAEFVAKGPTEKELADAKANLIGGFALRIDSNAKLLGNVANIAWNDLPLDYLDTWTAKVQALSVADIHRALQKALQPQAMATVIVGLGDRP
ncbi:peptidase M16 [Vandammella animalimorsus]|uniref:Peptidase M16 n=2 Tax=Vandammella animalimorsus TaxID=2029117 RepID=A0A2A2T811_9BURK|nr:peptidase M16 [Vandammella animalimorsus]PAX17971.1 peptidase M16 [Vandammella animalimorsus]PAX20125.1 peptidase M16 [Vandammella animalimorsus]